MFADTFWTQSQYCKLKMKTKVKIKKDKSTKLTMNFQSTLLITKDG